MGKSTHSNYVRVAATTDIPVGKMKAVKLESKELIVANVNGIYFATGIKCTHAGGDLSQGTLEGNIVTCPRHCTKFDVTTGKTISHPKTGLFHPKANDEPIYQVKIEDGNVFVKLASERLDNDERLFAQPNRLLEELFQ